MCLEAESTRVPVVVARLCDMMVAVVVAEVLLVLLPFYRSAVASAVQSKVVELAAAP
jgi:hypothetical protein